VSRVASLQRLGEQGGRPQHSVTAPAAQHSPQASGQWSLPMAMPASLPQQPPQQQAADHVVGAARRSASKDMRQSADTSASVDTRASTDTRESRLSVSIDPGDLPLSQLPTAASSGGGGFSVAAASGAIPLACGA